LIQRFALTTVTPDRCEGPSLWSVSSYIGQLERLT
jgi:hypothetical protein